MVRGGRGALGLFVFTVLASVVSPWVLMAVPFLLLLVGLPSRRPALVAAGILAVLVVLPVEPGEGLWYLERGWAVLVGGWFLGLTLRWPESGFFSRALGAVAGSAAVAALLFRIRPDSWAVVDWMITAEMREGATEALSTFLVLQGEGELPTEVVDAVYGTVEAQGVVFPALLGLASLAALGVAWWGWARLGRKRGRGLGPLAEFRFSDQLVWVFVLGLALVLLGTSGPWDRLGTNTVVFMGALYALRGVAVLLFLSGGVSVAGGVLLAVAFLFVAPVMAGGALVVGLGDTWLNLRERAAAAAGPEE